jgi:dihydrolipoamide dehydrogenase
MQPTPHPDASAGGGEFASNELSETVAETVLAPDELEFEELDPESIVEAAEALLREGAPHDFDVLIIGAGPGGYTAALRAAQLGAQVALVEEREVGGVCLNRGCIPTKSLLESVGVLRLLRRAREYGIDVLGQVSPDLDLMHARKADVVNYLRTHIEEKLQEAGVTILYGRARFVEEHTVEIAGAESRTYTAVHIIVATGGSPARLPIPGNDLPGVLTSDEVLNLRQAPGRLAVVGAGAVGIEFAYLFQELGSQSVILEARDRVLPQEDEDVQREMEAALLRTGIELQLEARLESIEDTGTALRVNYSRHGERKSLEADTVLLAAGRRPNIHDLGLSAAGIETVDGHIEVDENYQTSTSGVYAVGDCIRRVGWAHQSAIEGRMVAERILGEPNTGDVRFTPSCYYTHPEVASVGLTLAQAQDLEIPADSSYFYFRANGRAAAAGDHDGFVKLVFETGTERLLGCQIIGPRATDLVNEAVVALRAGWGLEELISTIHAHPTFAEAIPGAALAARRGLPGL